MSATGRAGSRVEKDNYPTPYWAIAALLDALGQKVTGQVVLDPCCGDGRVLFMATQYGASAVVGVEVREGAAAEAQVHGAVLHGDALQLARAGQLPEYTMAATNPPFSLAEEFIQEIALKCRQSTYWLLPLSFLASQTRSRWLKHNMPRSVLVFPARPSFIAVCKGRDAHVEERRDAVKPCGRKYQKGTKGLCECGGVIADGVDATEYAWFEWDGPGRDQTEITRLLDIEHLDRTF